MRINGFRIYKVNKTKRKDAVRRQRPFLEDFRLQFHRDVPCAPDNRTQVADAVAVADKFHAVFCDGGGNVADRYNHAVACDFRLLAGFKVFDLDAFVSDFDKTGVQTYVDFVKREEVAEIRSVRKADASHCDKVVFHFDDDGSLAFVVKVKGDFATGQAAADDDDFVADFFGAKQIFARFDAFFRAGNAKFPCLAARCDDDFVRVEFRDVFGFDLGVEFYFDIKVFDFLFVPLIRSRSFSLNEGAAAAMNTPPRTFDFS